MGFFSRLFGKGTEDKSKTEKDKLQNNKVDKLTSNDLSEDHSYIEKEVLSEIPSESSVLQANNNDLITCADCRQTFIWENAYKHQDTPGSSRYHPTGHGDFHPRAFCPQCGSLVAEWDIDRSQDYDRWKWYGENRVLNQDRILPPNPLLIWGKMPHPPLPPLECKKISIPVVTSGSPEKLFFAVAAGNYVATKAQLEAGVDPNFRNYQGETPLMIAALKGHEAVVTELLSAGAKLNDQEVYGRHTPLILATLGGHAPIVKILLEAGADPNLENQFGKTSLMIAKEKGHQDILVMLQAAKAIR